MDNCGVVTSITSVPASGSTFPLGTTTVNCSATDNHGNTSTCSFTVTVTHANQAPVAQADSYVMSEDDTLTVAAPGVLANDSDLEG
ncbi:HYR domain-containing protein, partial [Vibrio parahaemolyticus]|uniref:HYR domain-containing protein n=1 Tax=Vibrio parahaemolyticus TaxID=670 RepID=UPI003528DC14